MQSVRMTWSWRASHRRGSAVWYVGDQQLIAWGRMRPSGDGYALTVWWPRRQGVPDAPHRIEVVRWGAEHVIMTSRHRSEDLAQARADDLIRGSHERLVEAQRAKLLAELAELDDQSSNASLGGTFVPGASG